MTIQKISPDQLCEKFGIRVVPIVLIDGSVTWYVTLGKGKYSIGCTSEENARALGQEIALAIRRYGMKCD